MQCPQNNPKVVAFSHRVPDNPSLFLHCTSLSTHCPRRDCPMVWLKIKVQMSSPAGKIGQGFSARDRPSDAGKEHSHHHYTEEEYHSSRSASQGVRQRAGCIPRAAQQKKYKKIKESKEKSALAQKTFLFRWPNFFFMAAPRGVWVMLSAARTSICVNESVAWHCTRCMRVCLRVLGCAVCSFIAGQAKSIGRCFVLWFRGLPTSRPPFCHAFSAPAFREFLFADSFDLVSTHEVWLFSYPVLVEVRGISMLYSCQTKQEIVHTFRQLYKSF